MYNLYPSIWNSRVGTVVFSQVSENVMISVFLSEARSRSSYKWARFLSDLIFRWTISSPALLEFDALFGWLGLLLSIRFTEHIMQVHSSSTRLWKVIFRFPDRVTMLCVRFRTTWPDRPLRVLNISIFFIFRKRSSEIGRLDVKCDNSDLEYLIRLRERLSRFCKRLFG